jgi:hypothetical protein
MNKQEFDKLPVKERRVLMAKEVLSRLRRGKIKEKRGEYLISPKYNKDIGIWGRSYYKAPWSSETERRATEKLKKLHQQSAQEVFENDTCYVCAKGGLVYTWVILFNNKKIVEVINEATLPQINRIFPKKMRDMMEYLFEGKRVSSDLPLSLPSLDILSRWSIKKVMQNIVDNGGVLVYNGKQYG